MNIKRIFRWPYLFACFIVACATVSSFASTVTLSWSDNSTNETGFKIEKSIAGAPFVEIGVVNTDVKTYIDDAIFVSGVEYAYRVRAFNAAGNSGYSNTATIVWPSIPVSPGVLLIIIPE